jgi:hypothetical protein
MPGPRDQDRLKSVLSALSAEERVLVKLRDELYEGSWTEMLKDLEARRDGKPYVFKLASRVSEDIARIGRLRQIESGHQINLGEYV